MCDKAIFKRLPDEPVTHFHPHALTHTHKAKQKIKS